MDSSRSQMYDKTPRASPDYRNQNRQKAREMSGVVMPNSLFVGGISASSTAADLTEFFSKYGHVVGAKVVTDSRGLSKGYGFITFEDEEGIKKVQEEGSYLYFQNRRVNVAPAIKKHYPSVYDKLSDQSSTPVSGSNIHYQSSSSASSSTPYPIHGGMAYVTPHQYAQTPLAYFTPHEASNFYQGTPIVHTGINYGHYTNMVGTPYPMTSPILYPVASAPSTYSPAHQLPYGLTVSSGSSNLSQAHVNGHGTVNPSASMGLPPPGYAAVHPQGVTHAPPPPPPPVLHPTQMYAGAPVGQTIQEPYPQFIHGYYPFVTLGPHEPSFQYITVQDGFPGGILQEESSQNIQTPQEASNVVIADMTHTLNTESVENEIQENPLPVPYEGLNVQLERQTDTICIPEHAVPIEYAEPIFPPNYSHPPPNIQNVFFSSLYVSAKTNCQNTCEMDGVVRDSPRRSDYNRYKKKTPVIDTPSNASQVPFIVKKSYNTNPNRYQKEYKAPRDVVDQDTQYKPKGSGYFNKFRIVHNQNYSISYGQGEQTAGGYSTPSRNFGRPHDMSSASTYPQDNGYHQSHHMRASDSRYNMHYQNNGTYPNKKFTYESSPKKNTRYMNQNGGYRPKFYANRENANGTSDGSSNTDKTIPPIPKKKEDLPSGTSSSITAAGDSSSSSSCVTAQSSSSSTPDVCSQLRGLRL